MMMDDIMNELMKDTLEKMGIGEDDDAAEEKKDGGFLSGGGGGLSDLAYVSSWEPEIAKKIVDDIYNNKEKYGKQGRPYMVAFVGTPGSGKSVSTFLLTNELEEQGYPSMIMPHDGYHIFLDQLRTFPNADEVIYHRGAPHTFDPHALMRDLQRVRDDPNNEPLIKLPGFDHARGDPEPDKHIFDRHVHKIVICEGLYLLHDADGWEDVINYFDLTIYLESDIDMCIERVKIRNQCIPGYSPEEIAIRAETVDRANAYIVEKSKSRAMHIVQATASKKPKMPRSGHHSRTNSHSFLDLASLVPAHHEEKLGDRTEFTMEISNPRPRGDSVSSYAPSEGGDAESLTAVEPASHFIGSWETQMASTIYEQLSAKKETPTADDDFDVALQKQPYMVALVGMPGSGKSISAFLLASKLEELGVPTMIMPHDGYHYSMEYLRTFPNPQDIIYRRGAPDTFDPQSLLRDLHRIREGDEEIIKLPAFDHAKADPEPDCHIFNRSMHQVVICEGLYLLHNEDGWEDIRSAFDYSIFMNSDIDACMDRVKIRNQCIPGYTPEEIAIRVDKVDRLNALKVISSKSRADVVVNSLANSSASTTKQ